MFKHIVFMNWRDEERLIKWVERNSTYENKRQEVLEYKWDEIAKNIGKSVEDCKAKWLQLKHAYTGFYKQDVANGTDFAKIFKGGSLTFLNNYITQSDMQKNREQKSLTKESSQLSALSYSQSRLSEIIERQIMNEVGRKSTEIDHSSSNVYSSNLLEPIPSTSAAISSTVTEIISSDESSIESIKSRSEPTEKEIENMVINLETDEEDGMFNLDIHEGLPISSRLTFESDSEDNHVPEPGPNFFDEMAKFMSKNCTKSKQKQIRLEIASTVTKFEIAMLESLNKP